MRKCLALVLLACSGFTAAQQSSLTFLRADPGIVQQRIAPIPATEHERVEKLRHQFLAAKVYGPIKTEEQSVPDQTEPNLICTLPGSEDSTIIVGVNTAYKAKGDEAQVNWATLEMVPLLVESLASFPSRHNLVFVAFAGGKGKHSGAAFYLQQLSKTQGREIAALIELDHVGRTAPSYAPRTHSYILGRRLRLAAWGLKFQIPQVFFDRPYYGNLIGAGPIASTFENAKIAAITIYSRDYSESLAGTINGIPASVQHSEIDLKAYYDTYVLLCAYLRQIDRDLER